jgi:hypothetical protein
VKRNTILLVAVALLAGACARGGPGAGDELRVIPLEGDVFVLDGGEKTSIDEAEELGLGAVVATGDSGRALVDLPLGQAVELAPESSLRVTGDDETELLTGQVLAGAPAGLTVSSGAAEVSGSGGFFRLDRYVGAMRLGVYTGSATVHGWDGRLTALEQVGVAAGIVPEAPVPLQVDPSDPWDVRRLRKAIQVGVSLDDLQRGLGAELQGGAGPDTISRVLPQGLPAEDAKRYLQRVSSSEALVAAMVAIQAARRDPLSSLDALREVVRLRELGASWIVVVARWQLYTDAILNGLARITDLIARTLIPVVATGGTDATIGGAATTTSSGGGSGTGGTGSQTGTDTGGNTDGGNTDGGDGGGGDDGGGGGGGGGGGDRDPCASEVECAVQDVIGEAGGVGDGLGIG